MKRPLSHPRMGLVAVLCVLALVVLASWLSPRSSPKAQNRPLHDYPELFVDSVACPHRGNILASGRKSEELARLRSDRYAYDPGDGVRAVRRYQEAESCYRGEGDELGERRVRLAMAALTARVNTDYAAARLNLLNALEQERWSAAFSEIRRLLLLTDHIRRDEYVDWLRKNIGTIAAKASAAS